MTLDSDILNAFGSYVLLHPLGGTGQVENRSVFVRKTDLFEGLEKWRKSALTKRTNECLAF
jgi:hypothetical protein